MTISAPQRPENVPWSRFIGVLAGLAVSGVGQWYVAHKLNWEPATTALVLGGLVAAVLMGKPAADAAPRAPEQPLPRTRLDIVLDILGILIASAGLGGFGYACYCLYGRWDAVFDWAAPLAVGAVAVWSTGLAVLDRRWRNRPVRVPIAGWELVLLLAVMVLAFFLRFYRYDYFPPPDGFCAIEETQSGMGAWAIMHGTRPWEFLLDRWMPVPFFHLLGTTTTALRIPFTIVSGLTVLATYVLARQLVSPPAALFGTTLLAMSRWHLNYAREAHAVFPTTLIVVIIWALCVRAYKRGGLAVYPWIGFWSGYTLYAYAGHRATPVVVGAFLLNRFVVALRTWRQTIAPTARRGARRTVIIQTVGLLFAAMAVAGPVVVLAGRLHNDPRYFLEAANRSYLNKSYYTDDWLSYIRLRIERQFETARIFNHLGDTEQAYNLPGEPMLDPVTGVLFTVAVFYCLLQWRHRLQGYFVLTFLFLLIGGATLTQTLVVARLQGTIPLIFVLIAFAADRFSQMTVARLGRRIWPLLAGAALAVLTVAFGLNYEAYFGRTMNDVIVRQVYRNYYTAAIAYMHTLADDTYLLFVSDMNNIFIPNDYAWWRGDRIPGMVTADLFPVFSGVRGPWEHRQLRVLIQQPFEHIDLMRLMQERFPDAQCEVLVHPEHYAHLEMTTCAIPSPVPDPRWSSRLHAKYFRENATVPFLERDEPAISYAFVPDACEYWGNRGQPDCRVEWDGSFDVPEAGSYELTAEARQGDFLYTIDGRVPQLPLQLEAGPHTLHATAQFHAVVDIGARLRWRRTGTDRWRLLLFAGREGAAAQPSPGPD